MYTCTPKTTINQKKQINKKHLLFKNGGQYTNFHFTKRPRDQNLKTTFPR